MYPVIEARGEGESIIGLYAHDCIVTMPTRQTTIKLMNATKDEALTLRFDQEYTADVITRNMFGDIVSEATKTFRQGLNSLPAPCSGLIEIRKI